MYYIYFWVFCIFERHRNIDVRRSHNSINYFEMETFERNCLLMLNGYVNVNIFEFLVVLYFLLVTFRVK